MHHDSEAVSTAIEAKNRPANDTSGGRPDNRDNTPAPYGDPPTDDPLRLFANPGRY